VGVIGTIEGDVHDIGKNLVKTMLSASGFDMIDLGNDVPIEKFVQTAKEKKQISFPECSDDYYHGEHGKSNRDITGRRYQEFIIVMVGGALFPRSSQKRSCRLHASGCHESH
jgi:cobalamin-dependent methionine synthase I